MVKGSFIGNAFDDRQERFQSAFYEHLIETRALRQLFHKIQFVYLISFPNDLKDLLAQFD